MQVVALCPRNLHVAEAAIDADSVVEVDDVVVGVQLGEGREKVRRLGTPASAHGAPLAEDLGLGHQHESIERQPHAAAQAADERERGPAGRRQGLGEDRTAGQRLDVVAAEQHLQPVALCVAGRHHDETHALVVPCPELRHDGRERPLGPGSRAESHPIGRVRRDVRGIARQLLEALHLHSRPRAQRRAAFRRVEVEPLGRRVEATVVLRRLGVRGHLCPGRLHGRLDGPGAERPDECCRGHVVGEGSGGLVEIREQRLDAGQEQPAAHRLDQLAPFLACQPDLRGALVDQPRRPGTEAGTTQLLDGEEQHLLRTVERPLRHRIELAQALDLVTDELQADGARVAGREDVEDAAALGQVSRILHQRDAVVPPFDEAGGEGVGSDLLSLDDVGDRIRERRPRQAALRHRLDRGDDDRIGGLQEVVEALGAGGDHLARRRQRLEGRHLPAGQVVDATAERSRGLAVAGVEAQVRGERLSRRGVRGDHEDGTRPLREESREREGRRAAAKAGDAQRSGGSSLEIAPETQDELCQ